MTKRFIFLIACFAGWTHGSRLAAQAYNFQVAECGAFTVRPASINNSGIVVGEAQTIESKYARGFVYSQGSCETVPLPGKGTSFLGITNSNEIFGLYSQTQDYLLIKGKASPLPAYPGAYASYTSFKNASGIVGGNYYPTASSSYGVGFFYTNGAFSSLPESDSKGWATLTGLNDNNVAVGTFYGAYLSGFVFQNGRITYLEFPGATYTTFGGVNNHNLVVGTYYFKNTGAIGIFTYDLNSETWTDLNFPVAYNAVVPVGITDSGVIAALYTASGGLLIATPVSN